MKSRTTKNWFIYSIVIAMLFMFGNVYGQVQWNGTINTGVDASAIGFQTEATSNQSTAMGYQSKSTGPRSFVAGSFSLSSAKESFALGTRAMSTSGRAMAFGNNIKASAYQSMILGTGTGKDASFQNSIKNSLMIGFNSTIPTLFVGPSLGENTTGKVGIATTNTPNTIGAADISQYSLYVKGGILTEELRVRTGWADYVFADNYRLPSLYEVESYIKTNGHLPNVPSTDEVEEEGIEIGDITRIQQEKIEELTLYIIDLQKQLNVLEERLSKVEE